MEIPSFSNKEFTPAAPLHIQRLKKALQLDVLLRQAEEVFGENSSPLRCCRAMTADCYSLQCIYTVLTTTLFYRGVLLRYSLKSAISVWMLVVVIFCTNCMLRLTHTMTF